MLVKVISLVLLIHCVVFAEKFQPKACAVEDFQCNSQVTEDFLEKTASGDETLDIKPYDPLIIDSLDFNTDGVLGQFKNINVTGLRKQKITELKFDTVAKTAIFAFVTDVNIISNIEAEYEETKKKYYGTYIAGGKTAVRTTYDYQLKTDDKGVEHYESGPETLTCDFITFHGEISNGLLNVITNDPHLQKIYQEDRNSLETIEKRNVCKIVKAAYAVILDAARKTERAYPASAFFTNKI